MSKFSCLLPLNLLLFVALFLLLPYFFTHHFRNILEFQLFKYKLKQNGQPAFFFVANMYNNEVILPHWIDQFLEVADIIGKNNVFLSIFENDSKDTTSSLLAEFRDLLAQHNIKHKIVTSTKERYKRKGKERILHLARMRRLALHPLSVLLSEGNTISSNYHGEDDLSDPDPDLYLDVDSDSFLHFKHAFVKNDHSRLVFLNDIYFKAVDIVRLLSTANGDHDIACGLDFYTLFYDHYATRDLNGDWFSDHFPFVRHYPSQQLARRGQDFEVYSCWNGGVSMNPAPLIESGLTFRDNGENEACIHSECFLICEDYRKLGYSRIFINPKVKVTYQLSDYLFHQYLTPISDFFLGIFHYPTPKFVASNHGNKFGLEVQCGTP